MDQGFLNPKNILDQICLQEDAIACDLGCGSGGWVIPLAKKLERGKVFAVDILKEPLSSLEEKARQEKLFNIAIMLADAEKGVKIMEDSADIVLLTNILFQAKEKNKILKEAQRILKPGGKALIIDWKPEAPAGPREGRLSKEEIIKMAMKIGFDPEKEINSGKYHWGLLLVKN
ncbi:MAG: class I SAM-dependent methyltransferase [Candidatus Paceibacterota bacterium]|jgi:ubiquinone/menaquinone biosynthesis C-methylase UbiE|nr:class I SAM-dependent methyltransferase [Candidatus Paceibacterota bacterium]MDD4830676.1 class I SAM-dependent methyltransferase [Candidatus Paceibacterota bacterium]MDD4875244.1 class I SAM-dependent methyltransferase [Candidatus Paceibacterota bacterium]